MGKTCLWGFRPPLTQTNRVTEDYKRLTSSDLQSRGIYFVAKTKADLHLVFENAKIKLTHDGTPSL